VGVCPEITVYSPQVPYLRIALPFCEWFLPARLSGLCFNGSALLSVFLNASPPFTSAKPWLIWLMMGHGPTGFL